MSILNAVSLSGVARNFQWGGQDGARNNGGVAHKIVDRGGGCWFSIWVLINPFAVVRDE